MTTSPDSWPSTGFPAADRMREHIVPVLGPDIARRLRAFRTGTLYVDAPLGRAFLAWLIDVVVVWGLALALGVAVFVASSTPDRATGAAVITIVALVVLPFLYGWCYRNGRALGGLLTGTRLVREADGGRIGWGKAGWAMAVRALFVPFLLLSLFDTGGDTFSTVRTSIDDTGTRRLRAAGYHRIS